MNHFLLSAYRGAMETKKEILSKAQVKLTITVESQEFNEYVAEALKAFSREIKVDGFRSGNVPKELVEQKVGQGSVLNEAADLAVRETYLTVLEKERLEPLGAPAIKVLKLAKDNEFVYEVELSVLPEFELPDYRRISAKIAKDKGKEKTEVTPEEMKKAIDWLLESRSKLIAVKRPAKKGDKVEVDFDVFQNGAPIDNGKSLSHPLVLGGGGFVPGFEEKIEGLKEGEEKEFSLTFPKDYHAKDLAGKKADFKVKLKSVQEKEKPELTDAFAAGLGPDFKTVDDLKKNIEEGLKQEKENKKKEGFRLAVISEIAKKAKIDTPEVLIEGELEKMMEDFKNQIAQMGLEFDKYLASVKKTAEDLKKEWRGKASERVNVGLVLRQIAKQESLEPTETEITEEANKFLRAYKTPGRAKNDIESVRLREYTKDVLSNEKVFQFLESLKG